MIYMKLIFATTFVLLIAVTTFAQSAAQKEKIASDIKAVMNEQAVAWNRGDLEGFMTGYWKSEQLVFVSSRVTRGWQPTLDNYKKSYPDKAAMGTLSFTDLEVTVLSKDAATVLGSWALKREKDEPKGKFTLIFRKFKDGWRIVHDHTT
jgi:ketosteroid isomerase-like protein